MPAVLAVCLAMAGCDLAPKYRVPLTSVPVNYAQVQTWKQAVPADALPRGAWWRVYQDPVLDGLQAKLDSQNFDLQAEAAIYDQARAVAKEAQAGLLPNIGIGAHITANRQSARRPLRSPRQPNQYMDNAIDTQASYELDIWDKVANAVKAGKASAAATQSDLETLRLSLHAELAIEYFTLRGLDAQAALLAQTGAAFHQALVLTQNRFAGKIASGMDVSRAATQYADAEAQASDIESRRALSLDAIALLMGQPPSTLTIEPVSRQADVPQVDAGLPATLLQRRPDIASAERLVAAANAEIGVTRAAFYPNVSLNLIFGLQDTGFGMFNLPDSFWSVGPGLALPLFEGGLRNAEEQAAVAAYSQAVAAYKQTVVNAFGEVEDQLAQLHYFGQEQLQQDAAVRAAQQTLGMAMALYKDGATNFLDVVVAQSAELQAEQAALQLHTQRVIASVALIRSLGGGWQRGPIASAAGRSEAGSGEL